jgi:hypothetical protein
LNLRPHAYQPGNDGEVRHPHRKTIDGQRDLLGFTFGLAVSCAESMDNTTDSTSLAAHGVLTLSGGTWMYFRSPQFA